MKQYCVRLSFFFFKQEITPRATVSFCVVLSLASAAERHTRECQRKKRFAFSIATTHTYEDEEEKTARERKNSSIVKQSCTLQV